MVKEYSKHTGMNKSMPCHIHTYLPRDVLGRVFSDLRRHDLFNCSSVCSLWRSVANDVNTTPWRHLFWIPVTEGWSGRLQTLENKPFLEHDKIQKMFTSVAPIPVKKVKTPPTQGRNYYSQTLSITLDKKQTKEVAVFSRGWHDKTHKLPSTTSFFVELLTTKVFDIDFLPKLWHICVKDSSLWRFDYIPGPQNSQLSFFVFEVNAREYEQRVLTGRNIPMHNVITLAVTTFQDDQDHVYKSFNLANKKIPSKPLVPQVQPAGFRKNIKLYKYQLDCVSWMKSVELDKNAGYWYTDLTPWYGAKIRVLFNKGGQSNDPICPRDFAAHKLKAKPIGGVLAEEMGLGKTMEVIALMMANPGDPSQLEVVEIPAVEEVVAPEASKETTQPKSDSANTNSNNNNNDESKPQRATRSTRSKIEAKVDTPAPPESNNPAEFFKTNATLVLCPSHLIKQWYQEIEKCTRPVLNVVVLTNISEVRNTTYKDIVSADVVLVTFNLLKNTNYFRIGDTCRSTIARGEEGTRVAWVKQTYLKKIRNTGAYKGLDQYSPILEHFHWHRIVVDEAHEVMGNPFYTVTLASLETNYAWYVSGTPFPNVDTSNGIIRFLRFPTTIYYDTWVYGDVLLNNLLWRNTKASVKDEYQIPPVVEDLVLLDFTDIETALYADAENKPDRQRMVCCHASLEDKKKHLNVPLAKIRTNVISDLKTRLASAVNKISTSEATLKSLKKQLKKPRAEIQLEFGETIEQWKDKMELKILETNSTIEASKNKVVLLKKMQELFNETKPTTYRGPNVSAYATRPFELAVTTKKEPVVTNSTPVPTAPTPAPVVPTGANEPEIKNEEMKDKEEEEDDEDELKGSEIISMTVAQIKQHLLDRNVTLPKKAYKADLLELLKNTIKQKIKPVKGSKSDKQAPATTSKRKRGDDDDDDSTSEVDTVKKSKIEPTCDEDGEPIVKQTVEDRLKEQNVVKYLTEQHGTKLANIITYLRKLWLENPTAKVLFFSQFPKFLHMASELLTQYGVEHVIVEGNTVQKTKAIEAFKSTTDTSVRILLLNLSSAAAGTNLIEATHIIFAEPAPGTRDEALTYEAQAIGRSHRQGQASQITIVRFVIRGTIEYESYTRNIAPIGTVLEDDEPIHSLERGASFSGRPSMQRTESFSLLSSDETSTPTV